MSEFLDANHRYELEARGNMWMNLSKSVVSIKARKTTLHSFIQNTKANSNQLQAFQNDLGRSLIGKHPSPDVFMLIS